MTDESVLRKVHLLVDEEHHLRARLEEQGEEAQDGARTQLRHLEEELDQCWDLLRQRRALRSIGSDPDRAKVRPVQQIEGYKRW